MATSIVSDYAARMNLRDLRYLVALADERHFGRAAERCYVSQPTLSAQVRKLEEYLGVPLVERQPRRVALTDAGEKVVERARRLLHEADAIVELAKTDRDPLAGALKLALIPTVGPYLLPHVVRPPEARTAAAQADAVRVPDGTAAREAARRRDRRGHPRAAGPARRTRGRAAVRRAIHAGGARRPPARGPRAGQASTTCKGETLLLLEDGHCLRDQALEVCSRIRVQEEQDYRATSLETLRQMVAAGHGVTLMPQLAAESPVGDGPRPANQGRSSARRRRVPSARSGANRRRGRRRSRPSANAIRAAMKEESKR